MFCKMKVARVESDFLIKQNYWHWPKYTHPCCHCLQITWQTPCKHFYSNTKSSSHKRKLHKFSWFSKKNKIFWVFQRIKTWEPIMVFNKWYVSKCWCLWKVILIWDMTISWGWIFCFLLKNMSKKSMSSSIQVWYDKPKSMLMWVHL